MRRTPLSVACPSAWIMVVCGLLLGCASTHKPAASEREVIVERLGEGFLRSPVKGRAVRDPGAFLGLERATFEYVRVGDKGPERFKASLEHADDVWKFELGNGIVLHCRETEEGVVIVASEDHDQGVLSKYDPPEPLLLKGVAPGMKRTSTIGVTVYGLRSQDRVRYRGSLDLTYEVIGRWRVQVPAGTYDALAIKWDYRGEVGPAKIHDISYWFVSEGVGPVAIITRKKVSAMLVYNTNEDRARVLEKREPPRK